MDRILRILLAVSIFGGGDTIMRPGPINRRYGGGGLKRPVSNPRPMYGSPPMGDSYNSYNSGGAGGPPYGVASYSPPASSYEKPSVSYTRPFGLPEGVRFPNVGHTYKLPQVPPPLPPMKSRYISKPFPDYVIRFKSPLYPSEVTVYDKPRPSSGGYGSAPRPPAPAPPPPQPPPPLPPSYPPAPVPVYESSPPSKAPIPIYGSPEVSDPQVVTVIATNQDANVNPGLPGSGPLGQVWPASLPPYATAQPHTHTASVYVIDNNRLAADKLQTGSFELISNSFPSGASQNQNTKDSATAFVGLSHEPAFGTGSELGVIKPLTPDVVYTPNNPDNSNENFKPMYIFGPVYFPKEDGIARDNAESGSSNSLLKSTAVAAPVAEPSNCTKADGRPVDPNCISVTDATVDEVPASTAAPVIVAPVARDEEVEYEDDDDALSSGRGTSRRRRPGGRRGILGVVETILGLDREHDDSLHRADDDENIETVADDDYKDQDNDDDNYDARDSVASSNRESSGKRKFKTRTRTKTRSRYSGSNRSRTRYSSSSKVRSRPKSPSSYERPDEDDEQMRPAEDKKQTSSTIFKDQSGLSKDPGVIITQSVEQEGDEVPSYDDQNDGPDPVIGPVQIGYIGPPPPGSSYNPMQPFLYPAGISPFSNGVYSNGHRFVNENEPQTDDQSDQFVAAAPSSSGDQQIAADSQQSSVDVNSPSGVYEELQPQQVQPSDLSVAPAAVLEQPLPQDVPANSATTANSEKQDNPYSNSHSQGGELTNLDSDPTSNLIPYDRRYPDYNAGSIFHKQENQRPLSDDAISVSQSDPNTEAPPQHEVVTSSEPHPYLRQDTTTEEPYPTYPQTNSYPDDYETTSTAYADSLSYDSNEAAAPQNGYPISYDHTNPTLYSETYPATYSETSNQNGAPEHYDPAVTSHPSVYNGIDQDIGASSTDSNFGHSADGAAIASGGAEDLSDYKEAASDSAGSLYDYTNIGSSLNSEAERLPTTEGYQEDPEVVSTDSLTTTTTTTTTPESYTLVSRKPFPSFHQFRNRHRSRYPPKDKNYIAPTTYRPAYHIGTSAPPEKTPLVASVDDDITDGTANNYNSLHYDISPVTTLAPPTLAASHRLETSFPKLGEFPKHPQYGDRVIPKEKKR